LNFAGSGVLEWFFGILGLKVLVAGMEYAQGAIEFVVLAHFPLRSTRSPASYHRAVASANFLKTHAISATVNKSWSPRAFQKISDSTAQWFPLGMLLANVRIRQRNAELTHHVSAAAVPW
jgi:hypothetical protein